MNKNGHFLLELLITMAIITAILPPLTTVLSTQVAYFKTLQNWSNALRNAQNHIAQNTWPATTIITNEDGATKYKIPLTQHNSLIYITPNE